MTRPSLAVLLAALALAGCLAKVPPEERAGDPWRATAGLLTQPTNPN